MLPPPGAKLQDQAAECPLVAAQQGLVPNVELYWRNKLLPPLEEVFKVCLGPSALGVRCLTRPR